MKGKMKGQIFTLDVLASVLVLTIIIAASTAQLEQAYSGAGDVEYAKLQALANDISQICIKNILITGDNPNHIITTKWGDCNTFASQIIKVPYAYELSLTTQSTFGSCVGKSNIAVSKRIGFIQNTGAVELVVKVCL
jgi:hypothetical protein